MQPVFSLGDDLKTQLIQQKYSMKVSCTNPNNQHILRARPIAQCSKDAGKQPRPAVTVQGNTSGNPSKFGSKRQQYSKEGYNFIQQKHKRRFRDLQGLEETSPYEMVQDGVNKSNASGSRTSLSTNSQAPQQSRFVQQNTYQEKATQRELKGQLREGSQSEPQEKQQSKAVYKNPIRTPSVAIQKVPSQIISYQCSDLKQKLGYLLKYALEVYYSAYTARGAKAQLNRRRRDVQLFLDSNKKKMYYRQFGVYQVEEFIGQWGVQQSKQLIVLTKCAVVLWNEIRLILNQDILESGALSSPEQPMQQILKFRSLDVESCTMLSEMFAAWIATLQVLGKETPPSDQVPTVIGLANLLLQCNSVSCTIIAINCLKQCNLFTVDRESQCIAAVRTQLRQGSIAHCAALLYATSKDKPTRNGHLNIVLQQLQNQDIKSRDRPQSSLVLSQVNHRLPNILSMLYQQPKACALVDILAVAYLLRGRTQQQQSYKVLEFAQDEMNSLEKHSRVALYAHLIKSTPTRISHGIGRQLYQGIVRFCYNQRHWCHLKDAIQLSSAVVEADVINFLPDQSILFDTVMGRIEKEMGSSGWTCSNLDFEVGPVQMTLYLDALAKLRRFNRLSAWLNVVLYIANHRNSSVQDFSLACIALGRYSFFMQRTEPFSPAVQVLLQMFIKQMQEVVLVVIVADKMSVAKKKKVEIEFNTSNNTLVNTVRQMLLGASFATFYVKQYLFELVTILGREAQDPKEHSQVQMWTRVVHTYGCFCSEMKSVTRRYFSRYITTPSQFSFKELVHILDCAAIADISTENEWRNLSRYINNQLVKKEKLDAYTLFYLFRMNSVVRLRTNLQVLSAENYAWCVGEYLQLEALGKSTKLKQSHYQNKISKYLYQWAKEGIQFRNYSINHRNVTETERREQSRSAALSFLNDSNPKKLRLNREKKGHTRTIHGIVLEEVYCDELVVSIDAVVDFGDEYGRIAVCINGPGHYLAGGGVSGVLTWEDRVHQAVLVAQGWRVLNISYQQLSHYDSEERTSAAVREMLRQTLEQRSP